MRRFGYLHSDAVLPSMFVRRLTMLALVGLAAACVLVLQAYRLTVLQGDKWERIADSSLYTERYTPTTRGRIIDRKGRVLAEDRGGFDVLVSFDLITGGWADERAERAARDEAGEAWGKMSPSARAALIARERPPFDDAVESTWRRLAQILGEDREALDERRDAIKRRVQRMKGHLWSLWLEERQEALTASGRDASDATLADVASPIREQVRSHAIARGIDDERAARVRRLAERIGGIEVIGGTRRVYPHETITVTFDRARLPAPLRPVDADAPGRESVVEVRGVMPHVVGRLRELNRVPEGQALDTARRPERDAETGELDLGHYRAGDKVGGAGIEGSREDVLRGTRGYVRTRLDTGEVTELDAVPGGDVRLTVDAMLQARIHAALDPSLGLTVRQPWHKSVTVEDVVLESGAIERVPTPDGTPLAASVVVLDIETGGVLAMVSHPSYTREEMRTDAERIFGDPVLSPWVNRAVSVPYAPGSIVKPMVLCAAVTDGIHRLEDPIEAHGHLFPNRPGVFRDWIFKQYGTTFFEQFGRAIYGDEAIGVSSNIYFYTLGMQIGARPLATWYERFGVGEGFGLGAGPEYVGEVLARGRAPIPADAILMGIGQGPVAWTTMHAADAYATLARSGTRIVPRIDRGQQPRARELHLDPSAVDVGLEGLRYSIEHEWGTAHHITYEGIGREPIVDFPSLDVLAKTGTAEANATLYDPDGPEGPEPRRLARDGDHSWFVGLVGPKGQPPRYSIAVLVEYAGSGGRVSGPIANQVIHALIDEGYL